MHKQNAFGFYPITFLQSFVLIPFLVQQPFPLAPVHLPNLIPYTLSFCALPSCPCQLLIYSLNMPSFLSVSVYTTCLPMNSVILQNLDQRCQLFSRVGSHHQPKIKLDSLLGAHTFVLVSITLSHICLTLFVSVLARLISEVDMFTVQEIFAAKLVLVELCTFQD
jgi:hypothetical protein